jgi:activator of HSP90 ATPase
MSNIHHEIKLPAAPARVYRSLVDSNTFAELTGAPASGDATEGAAFSAFGGHITGRHVELVPNQRVVQAWRAKTWPEGLYSIARFELHADGKGTKLVFDHDGFPEDMTEHLAKGWQVNYWEKLAKQPA